MTSEDAAFKVNDDQIMSAQIFISYSHLDDKHVDDLLTMLKPLVRNGTLSVFSDQDIRPGEDWRGRIDQALAAAKVAVLLVSPNFLASDFIAGNELPPLLERARRNSLTIFWIAVSSSLYEHTEIARYQAAHDVKKPLDALDKPQRNKVLVEIVNRLLRAVQDPAPSPAQPASRAAGAIPPSPYPGLQPFGESQAAFFHGRTAEIERMLAAVESFHFLLVLGPSGSGKSSLVFAGLLPRLRERLPALPRPWTVLDMRPRQHPARNLDRRLPGALEDPAGAVAAHLAAQRPAERLLLVVDQFEECFTLADAEQQESFLRAVRALREVAGCTVVLTLRAAFFEDLMTSGLWPVATSDRMEVVPLSGEQLREAIERPAADSGVAIADGLVQLLLDDAGAEPGRLPLLQTTMELLWTKMRNGVLPLESYTELGEEGRERFAHALVSKAEKALDEVEDLDVARRIFLRLVQFVEGRPETRRQQPLSSLLDTAGDPATVERTVNRLADHGLLVVDRSGSGEPVDLAHEALITAWPTLRNWLAAGRDAEQTRRRLEAKAAEWLRFEKKGGLLDEEPLRELEEWLRGREAAAVGFSADLAAFAAASRRGLSEHEDVRWSVRAGDLASRAQAQLDTDPDLALHLAIEAVAATWRRGQPPLAAAEDALRSALRMTPVLRIRTGRALLGAAVNRDGRRLAATGEDGSVTLWSLETGEPEPIAVTGHEGAAAGVAFSPQGDFLATCGADGVVRVSDTRDGREIFTLPRQAGAVAAVGYSPSGHHLVTAGQDGVARLWNVATQELHAELRGHRGPLRSAAFNFTGTNVATAGDDAIVRLWKAGSGEEETALRGHVNTVWGLAWSPRSDRIATGGEDRTVAILKLVSPQILPLRGHTGPVRGVGFAGPDRIATAGSDDTVRLWNADNGQPLATFRSPGAGLRGLACAPTGRHVCAVGADGVARVWDATAADEVSVHLFYDAYRLGRASYGAADEPQILLLVSGSSYTSGPYRGFTQLLDAENGKTVTTIDARESTSAALQPGGALLAVAERYKPTRIFNAVNGQPVRALAEESKTVSRIAWSPDGSRLASTEGDGTVRIWNAATGELLRTLSGGGLLDAAFSPPDGLWIATAGKDGSARIWEAATGALVHDLQGHTGAVNAVAWSPDAAHLATAGADGTARIWDPTQGTARTLTGHEGGVLDLAWSPDGRTLATAGRDRTVRLWLAPGGQRRATLRGHTGEVLGVAFSPDGKRLASTGEDRTVRQFLVGVDELLAAAAARASRELTPEERAAYLA